MTSVEHLIQLANKSSSTRREKLWLLKAINAWLSSAVQRDSAFEDAPMQVISVLGACEGRCDSGRVRALVTSCEAFGRLVELALTVSTESAAAILRMREHARRSEPTPTRVDRPAVFCPEATLPLD